MTKYYVIALLKDGRRAIVTIDKAGTPKAFSLNKARKIASEYSDRHQIECIIELEVFRAASKSYRESVEKYRTQIIDDAEFIRARRVYDLAQDAMDDALLTEIDHA